MKFRKKPVVIDAMQFNGFIHGDLIPQDLAIFLEDAVISLSKAGLQIHTLEGDEHIASIGDWIIKGIKGEFYPCKPDIFEATYEPESSNSAIAARDKWWISQIQEMFDNPEWEPDYHCGCGAYFERKWQQLKREVGQ